MSKQIENEVVKMSFDNKDFEKNISTSSKSIEKLNEQLEFKDAKKGFDDLERYANNVNFDGLNKAIENINSVFTVTGNLTKKIIDDIAGYFESKISGAINSVRNTVGYITDLDVGVTKYEQYTTGMNTLVSNMTAMDKIHFNALKTAGELENEIEYIELFAGQLARFADETSYSFADMFETMAKMASSNVELEKGMKTMIGLANAAAVAGQNASTATGSMQQISQAFGRGYVQYQDWMQAISSRHIDTYEFKKTLAETAAEMKVIAADVVEDLKKKNKDNWFEPLFVSDQMNQGWLNLDVLASGMEKYSLASTYLLENIDSLGDDVQFSQILRWTEDFKKKGGNAKDYAELVAKSFRDLNIDSDALAETLEKLTSDEYELSLKALLAAQQATNFHEAIDSARDAFGTKFMYMLRWFIGDLDQARALWTDFSESLWSIFAGPLDATLEGLEMFNTEIAEVIEEEGELVEITWYEKFWDGVARTFGAVIDIVNDFLDVIRIFAGAWEEVEDETGESVKEATSIIETYTFSFMKKVTNAVSKIADALERFRESYVMELMLDIFKNLVGIFSIIRNIIHSLASAVIGTALKNIHKPLELILFVIKKITGAVYSFLKTIRNSDIFNSVIKSLRTITKLCINLFTGVLKQAGRILSNLIGYLKDVYNWIADRISPIIEKIADFIKTTASQALDVLGDSVDYVGDAFNWVIDQIVKAKDKFSDFIKEITGSDLNGIAESLKNLGSGFIEGASGIGGRSLDVLQKYATSIFDKNNKGSLPYLVGELNTANSAVEGAQKTIVWIGDALSNPIRFVFDLVDAILGTNLTKAADMLCNFISRVTGALANITPSVFSALTTVIDIIGWIVIKVFELIKDIIKFASGQVSTTGNSIVDGLLNSVFAILELLLSGMAAIITAVAKLAEYVKPAFLQIVDYAEQFMEKLIDKIKEIAKTLSQSEPQELLRAALGLFFLSMGILLIVKVVSFIIDMFWMIKGFGGPIHKISVGIQWVLDSASGLMDSIAGYGVPGLLTRVILLIFAIGYSMNALVKVAEAFTNPKKRKEYLAAIVIMFAFYMGIIQVTAKMFRQMEKESKKLNGEVLKYNIGSALLGVAAVLIGISFAMTKIAKTLHDDRKSAMDAAILIVGIIFALGAFLKIVQGQGSNRSKTVLSQAQGFGKMVEKSGTTYDGVAKTVKALAVSIAIISLAFTFMAKMLKDVDAGTIWICIGAVTIFMAALGAFIIILTRQTEKYQKAITPIIMQDGLPVGAEQGQKNGVAGFWQSAGIVLLITSITTFMVTIMTAITVCAAILQATGIDTDLFLIVASTMGIFMMILGVILAIILKETAEADTKWAIKSALRKVGKMVGISIIFTTFSIVLITIAGALAELTKVVDNSMITETVSETSGGGGRSKKGTPWAFIGALVGILALLGVAFAISASMMKIAQNMNPAELLLVATIFLTIALMINSIAKAIKTLTELFNKDSISTKAATGAVTTMVIMMGAIIAMIVVLGAIAGFLGGGSSEGGALILLAIAGAVIALALAMKVLALVIIELTVALSLFTGADILKGLLAITGYMALLIAFIAVLGVVGTIFGPQIVAIAMGLALIGGALLAIVVALLLIIPAVELSSEYLVNNMEKVEVAFLAIGEALALSVLGFIVGIIQGIADLAPELADAVIKLLNAFLDAAIGWLEDPETGYKIGEFWANLYLTIGRAALTGSALLVTKLWEAIKGVLYEVWDSIVEWLSEKLLWFEDLGKNIVGGISKGLLDKLESIKEWFRGIVDWVCDFLGIASPSKVFADIGENLGLGLLNGLTSVAGSIINFFTGLADDIKGIWDSVVDIVSDTIWGDPSANLSAQMDEDKKGVENYKASLIQDDFAKYMKALNKLESGNLNSSERSAYETQMTQALNNLSKIRSDAVRAAEDSGYALAAGFTKGLQNGEDPRVLGKQYMSSFLNGLNKEGGIASPSKETQKTGMFIFQGLEKGLNMFSVSDLGAEMFDSFITGFNEEAGIHSPSTGAEDSGSNILSGLKKGLNLDGLKETGKEMWNSLKEGFTSAVDIKGITEGMTDMFNTENIMGDMKFDTDFSMEGFTTDIDTSSYGNYSGIDTLDSLSAGDFSLDGASINNLDAYTTNDKAINATNAVESGNNEIVEQIKLLNEKMDEYTQAIQAIEMYLDTGALVGELVVPIDKKLGEKAKLKEKRGV